MIRTILKETRAALPNDFIIGVRLSPEDIFRANALSNTTYTINLQNHFEA